MMQFTTSWDDGCALDLRIAEILKNAGCTGTFYVCPRPDRTEALLSGSELRDLATHHEIGAHTLTHPHLPSLSLTDAKREIEGSKRWIEERTQKPCTMFCYPYGEQNADIRSMVRNAGFRGARTTQNFHFSGNDFYALGTSLQVYPFPFRPILNRRFVAPVQRSWTRLRELSIPLTALRGWLPMAKAVFQKTYASRSPWFHLWGHSWEVEKYHLWNELETFLAFVRSHSDVTPVPNSSLLSHADSSAQ